MSDSESKESFTLYELTVTWNESANMWVLHDASGKVLAVHAKKAGIISKSRDFRG
jgi:hypothetical protein